MRKPDHININDFAYSLPEDRIAKYPLSNRDESQILIYHKKKISKTHFSGIADILNPGDELVFNHTRVVQARLQFRKPTGSKIEIFILEPIVPSDPIQAFAASNSVQFKCLVGNAKKWKDGPLELTTEDFTLRAELVSRSADHFVILFSWDTGERTFAEVLELTGTTPIPPYLNRQAEDADSQSYQTIYAENDGSVAAPTAGLHFTGRMLKKLIEKGIQQTYLTLHVGAGTFIPVKEENALDHEMHAEWVFVEKEVLDNYLQGERLIAVGTTSMRSLESIYWLGVKAITDKNFSFNNLVLDQWEAYNMNGAYSKQEAIGALIRRLNDEKLNGLSFRTKIMIVPGYQPKMIDGLITNFHQPKSTLLLLIASIVGEDWKKIYHFALANDFRFLSYGDSSLLLP